MNNPWGSSNTFLVNVPLLALTVCLALIAGCAGKATVTNSYQKQPLGLDEELVPPNEDLLIDKIIAIHRDIEDHVESKLRPVPRGQHPKAHGCVTAEFIVESDLTFNVKQGIFQNPKSFPAIIRFSNGRQSDDSKADAHGMAVKLLNVGGDTIGDSGIQDFVMMDNPVFFVRNAKDYLPLMEDFHSLAMGNFFAKSWVGFKFLFSPTRQFRLLRKAASKLPDSPLTIQYWSTTPSKLGEIAMKFSAKPQMKSMPLEAGTSTKDKLRLAMSATLHSHAVNFDFLVQPQTDPIHMPVEDPTIDWDERQSPFIKVATIHIPVQSFESVEQIKSCEDLSFTPWHSLAEHRPLGGINRIRKKVYEVLSQRRHEMNSKLGN